MKISYSILALTVIFACRVFGANQQDIESDANTLMSFLRLEQDGAKYSQAKKDVLNVIQGLPQENINGLSAKVIAFLDRFHLMFPNYTYTKEDMRDYYKFIQKLYSLSPHTYDACIEQTFKILEGSYFYEKSFSSSILSSLFNNLSLSLEYNNQILNRKSHEIEYLEELFSSGSYKWLQTKFAMFSFIMNFSERNNNDDLVLGSKIRFLSRNLPLLIPNEENINEEVQYWFINDLNEKLEVLGIIDRIRLEHLFLPIFQLNIHHSLKICILRTLIEYIVPQHRREGLFVYVLPLERDDFIKIVSDLVNVNIKSSSSFNENMIFYRKLVISLAFFPPAERFKRVEQIKNLNRHGQAEQGDVLKLLDTRGNGVVRHWVDDKNRLLGVDVHESGREEKTYNALKVLIEHQGHLSTAQMNSFYTLCKEYINKGNFTDEQKRKALIALEGPRLENSWSSLLSQQPSGLFAELDGLSIIARLWHFADTFVDKNNPEETENLRHSFVLACADSTFSDGSMVCNQGKVQRIICATLQGRLPGVEVDTLPLLMGKELAARYLVTLQDRKIYQTTEPSFLSAAAAWLREQNVTIIPEERIRFMQDVKAFFHLSIDE